MVNEFWKYWKQRWPNASTNETVLKASANYQETRAAFLAGYQAAQQSFAADGLESEPKCLCPADGLYPGCPVHGNHRR